MRFGSNVMFSRPWKNGCWDRESGRRRCLTSALFPLSNRFCSWGCTIAPALPTHTLVEAALRHWLFIDHFHISAGLALAKVTIQ